MTSYERLVVGETFECGVHLFTAEEIKRFAVAYDPQRFHTDEAGAAETHFGGLCASGWHTAAAMMRHFVRRISAEIEAARARGESAPDLGPSLGFDALKWQRPVYVGDQIAFSSRIVAKRESDTQAGWGIVSIEASGVNQRGELVFACTSHFMVAKTEAG